jgi:adenosylcobinamide-GDP ribazoletransferase
MRLFLVALQFLTIIPIPFPLRCEERDMGRAMAFFPLVGLILGAILAGADYIISPWLPRVIGDLILVTIMSVLTGCLHLDGLADVCDALAARGDRERFLAVMKDSRIGAVGVVGLVLGILLKYEAILSLPIHIKRDALLLFPMAARFCQVLMTVGAKRARTEGLGAVFIDGAGIVQLVSACIIALACAWLFFGVWGVCALIPLWVVTWIIRGYFNRRLGGISGDIVGFANEVIEIMCLLLLLVFNAQKIL